MTFVRQIWQCKPRFGGKAFVPTAHGKHNPLTPVLVMLIHRFIRFLRHLNLATLREVIDCTNRQRLPGLAAEMAYNALLALFPAILTVMAAIGLFQSLQVTLYNQARLLGAVAPDEVRILIGGLIADITSTADRRLFSLGFIISLWIFSSAISAAMAALDQIHQIPIRQARSFWKAKLVSLCLTVGTILLLMIASFLVFVSEWLVRLVANQSCWLESGNTCQIKIGLLAIWRMWSWPIALAIVATAFAFIYYFGPSRRNRNIPIFPGAILAAISWAILSGLFRFYVSHFGDYNRIYGAVGTIIVLQLWLYLSSLVMLIGAQLNVTVGKTMQHRATLKEESEVAELPSPPVLKPLNDPSPNGEQE